jgi:hypothetical protein
MYLTAWRIEQGAHAVSRHAHDQATRARRKAGSRGGGGRTVPTVSAIRMRQTTTASRLRQKPETVTLFSTSESLFSRFRRPMSYSLERRSASLACRKGSADGRSERRWAS